MSAHSLFTNASRQVRADSHHTSIPVVVVDESASFLDVICSLLDLGGRFEVVARATNGIDGFLAVAALHPKLVLLEVSSAGTNGWLAANLIATRFPEVKVALMSMDESVWVRERCIETGADAFIAKRRFREDVAFACAEMFSGEEHRRTA